jgi:hypothetical protein
MKPLTATELLAVWERGLNLTLLERIISLLATACPEMDREAICGLRVGERDVRLMQLREWMFGPRLVNTAHCPQCAECVEWENHIPDLIAHTNGDTDIPEAFDLDMAGYQLRFRLPDSKDIANVLEATGNDPRFGLIKRCVLSARHSGRPCDIRQLPETVFETLGRRMEALDPQTEIRIALTCPTCGHRWGILFDIASFLWEEINAWAERMIITVHQLASRYGWSEAQILNLSPVRRQLYLGLVNQ